MKNRFSIGKFSVGKSYNAKKANDSDVKFALYEIVAFCSMATLFLAIFIPHKLTSTIFTIATLVLFFVAAVLNFAQQSPIVRWLYSVCMTFVIAAGWTGYTLVRYFSEGDMLMLKIAAGSIIMWALFAFCLYKWSQIRNEAQTDSPKRKGTTIFYGWGNKGRKLFIPDVENGKLDWADFTLFLAITLLSSYEKLTFIPEFPFKQEIIYSSAILLVLISYYRYYHSLCPISRWHRSSWATGMTALAWTFVPLIVYITGLSDNWEKMWQISIWSIAMWVVFAFCRFKLWQVRKRTRAEVAMIEWRSRNKKRIE